MMADPNGSWEQEAPGVKGHLRTMSKPFLACESTQPDPAQPTSTRETHLMRVFVRIARVWMHIHPKSASPRASPPSIDGVG
jgi:hypothetical protein